MALHAAHRREEKYGATRDQVLGRLGERRAEARPIWTPLHTMEIYAKAKRIGGAVAERLFAEALSIPSSVQLTPAEQDRVIAALTS